MSALEQEIRERFQRLSPSQKQRMLHELMQESSAFDYETMNEMAVKRNELRQELGEIADTPWIQDLVRELREEESD